MRRLAAAVFLSLAAALQAPLAAADAPRIGVILPLSGDLAVFGAKLRRAIEMANQDSPRKAELLFEDGAADKKRVLSAFNKLADLDGVRFIIGPFGPDQALAIAPLAERRGIVMAAVSLCEDRFLPFANLFCFFPSAEDQIAPLLARFSRDIMGERIRRAAFLGEEVVGFAAYRKAIENFVRTNGYTLALLETFAPGTMDFRLLLTKTLPQGADLLIVGGVVPAAVAAALRQARELRLNSKFCWYLSEHDSRIFAEYAEILEGCYSSAIPRISGRFIESFRSRTGAQPDLYHALAYDAARALIDAADATGGESWQAAADFMKGLRPGDSATIGFRYDAQRRLAAPVAVSQIRGGKQVFPE